VKIALLTDAWHPQVNGVVRTWSQTIEELEKLGHAVHVIHPAQFKTVGAPRYPEIRLAILPGRKVAKALDELKPDVIHIATEGSIGMAGRRYCRRRGLPFTTCYHTQFPHYLREYFFVPKAFSYRFIRWFHGPSKCVLVPTPTVARELESKARLDNVRVWCRGVDTQTFQQYEKSLYADLPRPIFVNAGRVAREKNIEAFLALDLPGSKVVVGDGPVRETLARKYPDVHWAGYRHGEELGRRYASADVFVFPSKTDTFGVVMLEANACGLPVAAYPVTGPIDVVQQGTTGILNDDLRQACLDALELDAQQCRAWACEQSWERVGAMALESFVPLNGAKPKNGKPVEEADQSNDTTGEPVASASNA